MPILGEEPELYPKTLLDTPPLEPPARRWLVLYTKARQEKAVARQALGWEIPFYLPLVKKRILSHGRKFLTRIPLFAGYIFLYGTEEERLRALTTNRIIQTIAVPEPDRLRSELQHLHRLTSSGAPLMIEDRLCPGMRVRVRQGPLMGVEGTVLKRHGQTRLFVAVDFLQRGASVEIEAFLLEPI